MSRSLFDGRSFAAMLFDMDGTVLNSIAATERVWRRWAARHGVDAQWLLQDIHGRRANDTVAKLNLPGVDPVAEGAEVMRMEMQDVDDVHAIAGVREFLESLPADRWAIVTSAPPALAARRLGAAGLELPRVIVTADDTPRGKPDPSGFQLAAQRLGVDVADCVVFEDALAGVQAGEAAGAEVVVISATHARPLSTSHPVLESFEGLRAEVVRGRIRLIERS